MTAGDFYSQYGYQHKDHWCLGSQKSDCSKHRSGCSAELCNHRRPQRHSEALYLYIPLLLSLSAGTRISETVGLKYSDVDFTSNTIYIDRQLGRSLKNEADSNLITQQLETKTPNGIRSIPIPDWVADELIVRRAWYT